MRRSKKIDDSIFEEKNDDSKLEKTEVIEIVDKFEMKGTNSAFFKKSRKKVFIIFSLVFCLLFLLFALFRKQIVFNAENDVFYVDVGSDYSNPVITACYGNRFKCVDIGVSVDSSVDSMVVGDYQVKYIAKYGNKVKTFVKNVSVVDTISPVIETASDSISVCPNVSEYSIDYKANDNYDGDLTDKVSSSVVDDSLILSVSDSSSNYVSKTISIVHEDLESPVITLAGNQTVYVALNSKYSDPGYSALDNCDGDVSSNVSIDGSVDTSHSGNYTINYSITDSSGNSSSVSRNVNVFPLNNGSGNKVVYLTFDDGPSPYTGELLDVLARYNVKATFFVTNRNPDYNHFIKRAFDEGHTIALHTSTHNYSQVYSSVDAYFNDLNAINETVKNITGNYSHLIRFPGGSSNTVSRNYSTGIMTTLAQMVTDRGYKYFDWNVSSGDADGKNHPSSYYSNNIIGGISNRSMSIVLQHDTNVNSIRSVSDVIEYGLANGFIFKPLDMNSPVVHHGIAN